jgi:serine/threonine protein kinase
MAETFLAVKRGPAGFEQRVCLKRVLPARAEDERFLEQFWDEARLLAHLHYPGIVQVHDFGESDGAYYMALELVDGTDLERLTSGLRKSAKLFPDTLALYVTGEILSALHYAHSLIVDGEELGIVHRDISPSNILISKNGDVKLTDFGIAKFRSRRHKTETGYVKGKIAYMSPEQVRGDELDARSDIFSVGVLLHEIVTGVHPFDAATDITLLSNILTGNRPALRSLLPHAGSALVVLIDALLETDRDRRPASAVDALRLIPAVGPEFELKRELGELVRKLDDRALTTKAVLKRAPSTPAPAPASSRREDLDTAPLEPAYEPVHGPLAVAATESVERVEGAPAVASRASRWPLLLLVAFGVGAAFALRPLVFPAPTDLSSPSAPASPQLDTADQLPAPLPIPLPPEQEQRAAERAPATQSFEGVAGAAEAQNTKSALTNEGALGNSAEVPAASDAGSARHARRSPRSAGAIGNGRPLKTARDAGTTTVAPVEAKASKRAVGRSGASVSVDDF